MAFLSYPQAGPARYRAGPIGAIIAARQQTSLQLANILENQLGKPVVDKTGLTAKYDNGFAFDATGLAGESGRLPRAVSLGALEPHRLSRHPLGPQSL